MKTQPMAQRKLLGYRCDVASDGREALDSLLRQPYDVVLMDVQMPEMNGYEVTAEIRRQFSPDRQPQIIALTAHASAQDREDCLQRGMDDSALFLATLKVPLLSEALLQERHEIAVDLDDIELVTGPQVANDLRCDGARAGPNL